MDSSEKFVLNLNYFNPILDKSLPYTSNIVRRHRMIKITGKKRGKFVPNKGTKFNSPIILQKRLIKKGFELTFENEASWILDICKKL